MIVKMIRKIKFEKGQKFTTKNVSMTICLGCKV